MECLDEKGYDSYPPKVETVFSVEKRMIGLHALAQTSSQQYKELVSRALPYKAGG